MLISQRVSLYIHLLTKKITGYLLAILVVSQIVTVLLRYIYNTGFLALHDISLYSFGALVLLSIIYTFGKNQHVRVDVFREHQSLRVQQNVDIASMVFFLIPFYSLVLYWVWPDIQYAWSIKEGSQETGGLGGLYLVKSTLPLLCIAMLIQGLVVIMTRGVYLDTSSQEQGQSK